MGTQQAVTPVRVVLDTSIVVVALRSAEGRLRWLRHAWQQGGIVPLVNQATTLELLRVLAHPKFELSQAEQEDVLAEYLPYCEVAAEDGAPVGAQGSDRAGLLDLARAAHAAYLVTGDAELLRQAGAASPEPIAIVTPEQLRTATARSN